MSFEYNYTAIQGRLTRDPETSYTNGGKQMCRFSIANGRGNQPDDVNFVDITAWGKSAEFCGKNLKKGSLIIVQGRLRQDRFKDKVTGENRSKFTITVSDISFVNKSRPADRPQQGNSPAPESDFEQLPPQTDIPF